MYTGMIRVTYSTMRNGGSTGRVAGRGGFVDDEVVIDLRKDGGPRRSSPVVAKRELLSRLVSARRAHYDSRELAAEALGWSTDKQRFIENGRTIPSDDDIDRLDEALQPSPEEVSAWRALVVAAKERAWWDTYSQLVMPNDSRRYIGLEWGASEIRSFDALVIHGLMQTTAYSEWMLRFGGLVPRPAELVGKLLEVRRRRWDLLLGSDPVAMDAVLDEAALRRVIGPPEVMGDQLLHLVELAGMPQVTLRVIPFTAGAHAGMSGSFSLMSFGQPGDGMVYIEGPGQVAFLEGEKDRMRYSQTFDSLLARALSPEESQAMLRSVAVGFGAQEG